MLNQIHSAELTRKKAGYNLELTVAQQQLNQRTEELRADVEAVVSKAQAVSPQLAAALRDFSDKTLAGKMAETMAPLAILGGKKHCRSVREPAQGDGFGEGPDPG